MNCLCPNCLSKYDFNNQTNIELLSFLKNIPNHELAHFAKTYYEVNICQSYVVGLKTTDLNENIALHFFVDFQIHIKNKKYPYNIDKKLNKQNSHYPRTLIEDMKKYFKSYQVPFLNSQN